MICSPFPKLLKMLLQEIRTARDSAACDLCREPPEKFPGMYCESSWRNRKMDEE
jgi:hypothetical protein